MLQFSNLYRVVRTQNHFKSGTSSKNMNNQVIFKKILQAIIIVLSVTQFSCVQKQQSEMITEENYLKVDSLIWAQYEQEMKKISECYQNHPEKKDSLIAASEQVDAIASKKNIEAAIKYASVPSGLRRLYMLRLNIAKDTILSILKNIPDSMQFSPYGRSLLYHIETEQIVEGSNYYDFQSIDTEGRNFTLSSLEGKNILLLYGGLGCMGPVGREYLNKIYQETSRKNFEIVVYCPNSDLESLQKVRTAYPCDFLLVSDFLQDHTPIKILYGAQATPTCFFINQEGLVVMKTTGLHQERVSQLLSGQ